MNKFHKADSVPNFELMVRIPCYPNDTNVTVTNIVPWPNGVIWANSSWPRVRQSKLHTSIAPEAVEEIAKGLEKKGKKALANKFKSAEAKKNQVQKFLEAAKKRKKK